MGVAEALEDPDLALYMSAINRMPAPISQGLQRVMNSRMKFIISQRSGAVGLQAALVAELWEHPSSRQNHKGQSICS